MSFTAQDLEAFARFVRAHDRTVTMAEAAAGAMEPGMIALRHDVDAGLAHALRFARWEQQQGFRASFYLLPTASYWDDPALASTARAIQAAGHEVGVHHDAFRIVGGDCDAALALLASWADQLRGFGIDVRGCADHGGGDPSNTDLWRVHGRQPAEAGLEYEAYLVHRRGAHYLTDSHGHWHSEVAARPDRPTHVLQHPQHWQLP